MRGIRFYQEYASASDKRHDRRQEGVVLATFPDNRFLSGGQMCVEGMGVVPAHPWPNCDMLCGTSIAEAYLRERCKRISETEARQRHPAVVLAVQSD